MDVNSINNNLTSLNNLSTHQLGSSNKTEQTSKSDQSLYLNINDYNKRRDELSATLQSYNEGIGISITAQSGLEKEKDYLKSIQNKLSILDDTLQNTQDKNLIKNDLNQELLNFRETAYQTTYKKENLLYVDQYDKTTTIDIASKDASYSIEKPNTPEIASQVANAISRNDFNTQEGLITTIQTVQESIKELDKIQSKFQDLKTTLQEGAKESINTQKQLLEQNKITKKFDFPKEVTDFSKSNVNANAGYLAASQANIVQEQSIRLVGVR